MTEIEEFEAWWRTGQHWKAGNSDGWHGVAFEAWKAGRRAIIAASGAVVEIKVIAEGEILGTIYVAHASSSRVALWSGIAMMVIAIFSVMRGQ
jgi:hypothetical protein